MPTKIKRGQSLLIPFKDGLTIYDSQNKPRMYLTQKAFEKSFPGHLIAREGVELVEYVEVVRCRDCLNAMKITESERFKWDLRDDALQCGLIGHIVLPDGYCDGGVKANAEVEG